MAVFRPIGSPQPRSLLQLFTIPELIWNCGTDSFTRNQKFQRFIVSTKLLNENCFSSVCRTVFGCERYSLYPLVLSAISKEGTYSPYILKLQSLKTLSVNSSLVSVLELLGIACYLQYVHFGQNAPGTSREIKIEMYALVSF